ncbi:MAG: tRNA pseudouridine(38-40) synthase TruA [Pseudomonadota bacterium]
MPRYKLTLEYHGSPFVGWQRQAEGLSVQGVVEDALRRLEADAPGIAGAGRTDAGVHATGQVAHCDLAQDWDAFRLSEALNHHLKPHPVAVLACTRVADEFHARFSAERRHYLYRIANRRAPLAVEAGLAWRVPHRLEADAMARAARALVGKHDFTTFRSAQCQAASPVKTLDLIAVARNGDEIAITLNARSFLHNQVRSIVGTLERVGAGKWPEARVGEVLTAADRAACGPVAPPDGLYLTQVDYPEPDAPDQRG